MSNPQDPQEGRRKVMSGERLAEVRRMASSPVGNAHLMSAWDRERYQAIPELIFHIDAQAAELLEARAEIEHLGHSYVTLAAHSTAQVVYGPAGKP